MSNGALISQGEAVDLLGVSNKAFYRMVKAGVLQKRTLPGMTYGKYLRSEVDQLVQAGLASCQTSERLIEEFCKRVEQEVM